MGLKLIHISKRGNWWSNPLDITLVELTINCLCKTFPDFAIKVLCFLTTINLTFKFQLMVHEKLSWRNCKCPVDLWQPGQIVLKKFHPSKNPEQTYLRNRRANWHWTKGVIHDHDPMTLIFWWPRWAVRIYLIVTGVISDVCVPPWTHLVIIVIAH